MRLDILEYNRGDTAQIDEHFSDPATVLIKCPQDIWDLEEKLTDKVYRRKLVSLNT